MTLATDIIELLKKYNDPVVRNLIQAKVIKSGYSRDEFFEALKELENVAHIGQWYDFDTKENYLCWYPPNELTNKVQECLDRGDDW